MAKFSQRIIGAIKLDVGTYEEVEADPSALGQAMAVVLLSSLAAGIGAGIDGLMSLANLISVLLSWFVWAGLTYFIGTRILPSPQTHADWGQLLRTTGFAAAPGILRIAGIIPFIRELVFSIASIWMLAAFVIAVRQALDYESTGRAIGVCLIGFLINVFLLGILLR
mgnify:CR=1 FL=1